MASRTSPSSLSSFNSIDSMFCPWRAPVEPRQPGVPNRSPASSAAEPRLPRSRPTRHVLDGEAPEARWRRWRGGRRSFYRSASLVLPMLGLWYDHYGQQEGDPHGVHHLERPLCHIVEHCGHEKCEPQPAELGVSVQRTDDVPVSPGYDEPEQGHSYPSQVEKDLQVAVVRLVRMPQVLTP